MTYRIDTLDKEIAEAQNKLADLQAFKAKIDSQPEDKRLAEYIHDLQCHWSHTDRCTWHYEIKNGIANWGEFAHAKWLTKAQKLLEISDYDTILKISRIF